MLNGILTVNNAVSLAIKGAQYLGGAYDTIINTVKSVDPLNDSNNYTLYNSNNLFNNNTECYAYQPYTQNWYNQQNVDQSQFPQSNGTAYYTVKSLFENSASFILNNFTNYTNNNNNNGNDINYADHCIDPTDPGFNTSGICSQLAQGIYDQCTNATLQNYNATGMCPAGSEGMAPWQIATLVGGVGLLAAGAVSRGNKNKNAKEQKDAINTIQSVRQNLKDAGVPDANIETIRFDMEMMQFILETQKFGDKNTTESFKKICSMSPEEFKFFASISKKMKDLYKAIKDDQERLDSLSLVIAQYHLTVEHKKASEAKDSVSVDPVVNPVVNPVVDPVVDPIVNPVVDPVVNPVVNPVVDPVVDPIVNPVVNPVVDPVVDPNVVPNSGGSSSQGKNQKLYLPSQDVNTMSPGTRKKYIESVRTLRAAGQVPSDEPRPFYLRK